MYRYITLFCTKMRHQKLLPIHETVLLFTSVVAYSSERFLNSKREVIKGMTVHFYDQAIKKGCYLYMNMSEIHLMWAPNQGCYLYMGLTYTLERLQYLIWFHKNCMVLGVLRKYPVAFKFLFVVFFRFHVVFSRFTIFVIDPAGMPQVLVFAFSVPKLLQL